MSPLPPLLLVLLILESTQTATAFDYPAGVNTWCGKAYRNTCVPSISFTLFFSDFIQSNGSFKPGGWLSEPTLSSSPLLNLQVRPRMNIYIADDEYGSVIVDTPISYMHGDPYCNSSFNKQTNVTSPFTTLFVDISVDDTGLDLVSSVNVTVNSTANEFVFSLSGLNPQFEPYSLTILGASGDGNHSYVAKTLLHYLPNRSDGGSTVKIDSLYGGIVVQDFKTNSTTWTSLFPYTYYVLWMSSSAAQSTTSKFSQRKVITPSTSFQAVLWATWEMRTSPSPIFSLTSNERNLLVSGSTGLSQARTTRI